jgi:hypothetical protein
MIDPKLLDYCATDRQREIIQAVLEHGSANKAAKAMGANRRWIDETVLRVKGHAARQGWGPEYDLTHQIAPGQILRGASTLYGADGQVKAQWVLTQADKEAQLQMLRDAVSAITDDIKPVVPVAAPTINNADLMVVVPQGDPHIGMYAWAEESGHDFDVDIARADLCGAMQYLSDNSPPAETCMILNLGDFFHADNALSRTKSGNVLDTHTRWGRVMQLGILTMVDCIDIARKKHSKVIVHNLIGNHDEHSSQMLALCLQAWFRDEPRVEIRPTIAKHTYERFGSNLIGMTHGDTIKRGGVGLDSLMAADRAKDWGETRNRYWYTGHIHSTNKAELTGGVVWESFRNLAPNDAYHQGQGYRSGRNMTAIVLHKDHGEVARATCDISIVRSKE